jgi:hypothetical protein
VAGKRNSLRRAVPKLNQEVDKLVFACVNYLLSCRREVSFCRRVWLSQIYCAVEKEVFAWTQIVIDQVQCCAGELVRRSFRPAPALSSDLLGRKLLRSFNQWGKVVANLRDAASARSDGGFFIAFANSLFSSCTAGLTAAQLPSKKMQNGGSYGVSERNFGPHDH